MSSYSPLQNEISISWIIHDFQKSKTAIGFSLSLKDIQKHKLQQLLLLEKENILDLYLPNSQVIRYPACSAGIKLWKFKGGTWKIRNPQSFPKISGECFRVSLKESQCAGEKKVGSQCHGPSHLCLILFWVHCRAVFNKSSSFLWHLQTNLFQVAF